MMSYDKFEIKVNTLLVGLFVLSLAFSVGDTKASLFVQGLIHAGIDDWWDVAAAAVGSITAGSALTPRRRLRHHALIASWLFLWATSGAFVFWGAIPPPVIWMWTLGTSALICLLVDVRIGVRKRLRGE